MKLLLEAFQMAMAAWTRSPEAGMMQAQVHPPPIPLDPLRDYVLMLRAMRGPLQVPKIKL